MMTRSRSLHLLSPLILAAATGCGVLSLDPPGGPLQRPETGASREARAAKPAAAETARVPELAESTRASIAPSHPLIVEPKSVQASEGNCETDSCAKILIEYPEITSAPTDEARDAIATLVHRFTTKPILGDDPQQSEQEVVRDFIEGYKKAVSSLPPVEASGTWNVRRSVTIPYRTDAIASLEFTQDMFTGGAHGSVTKRFAIIDLKSGRTLSLKDIIREEALPRFREIAERQFRKVKQIGDGTTLAAAGFLFPEDRFTLNDNVGLRTGSIVIYYNEYEIAPYSLGSTEIEIPFAVVEPLAKIPLRSRTFGAETLESEEFS